MRDVLTAMIKAHEIQGCIALENSFNKVGLDHVVLVKVASTAVVCQLLGLTRDQTINALSLAWVDGQSLRTYRHAPNTGSRKSWAAGDATSRAVRLALMARSGRDGLSLGAHREDLGLLRRLVPRAGVQVPAAVRLVRDGERALQDQLPGRVPRADRGRSSDEAARAARCQAGKSAEDIRSITIRTHEACLRIIDKKGPLANPADRDHCVQYMVAIPLLFGRLTAADYEDCDRHPIRASTRSARRSSASKSRTSPRDYHDPDKRSIANCAARRIERRRQCSKKPSNIPSAIAAAAKKECRCWSKSSKPTCAAASPKRSSSAFSMPRSTPRGWMRCP